MRADNVTRKIVVFNYGFNGSIDYGCDYEKLTSIIDVKSVLPYMGLGEVECKHRSILYALGGSCKDLDFGWGASENYNVFINVWCVRGEEKPTIAVCFRIEKKQL